MASVAYNIYLASDGFYVLRSGVLLFLGVVTVVVTCGVRHNTKEYMVKPTHITHWTKIYLLDKMEYFPSQ